MTSSLARLAGDALAWRALQLGGTKGIFFIRTIVLARLLSPDDFGLFAIATVALGVLMATTELGMVPALVHRADAGEAHYNGAWTVGMARALAIALVLAAAAAPVAAAFAEPRAADVLRWLALKPVIDAAASIKVAALVRQLAYRRLALAALPAVLIDTGVSIALATRYGVWALVAGALAGAAAGVLASYLAAPHRPRIVVGGEAIRPLVRYGRWIFLTGLVAVSASSLTQLVISRELGAFELGLYFLAAKLAFLPYEVASQVVGEVAFPLYARIQDDRARVAAAFRSVLTGTVVLLLPVYVFLIALGPWFVQSALGDRWAGTEPLVQLLAVAGAVGLFGEVCTPLFRGLGYPRWGLVLEVVQSTLVIALLWTLTRRYGVVGAACAWIVAVLLTQVVNYVLARRLVERPIAGAMMPVALVLIAASAGTAAALGVRHVAPGIGGLLAAAALAVGVTGMILWLVDKRLRLGLGVVLAQTFPQVAGRMRLVPVER